MASSFEDEEGGDDWEIDIVVQDVPATLSSLFEEPEAGFNLGDVEVARDLEIVPEACVLLSRDFEEESRVRVCVAVAGTLSSCTLTGTTG